MSAPRRGLRVLAVDDEEQALAHLVRLLRRSEDVCEVVTAADGAEALRVLNRRSDLDALLLDIQMPDLDGIDLATVLAQYRSRPALVFVTAHEQHAVKAFELGAVDYLLKPVSLGRLTGSLERVRGGAAGGRDGVAERSAGAVLDDLPRLTSRTGATVRLVERDGVRFARCEGDYVRVYAGPQSHLVRESISALSVAWAGHGFVRVHRSFIVRVGAVSEVRSANGHRSVVVDGHEIPVSRRYWRLLADGLSHVTA